MYSYNHVIPLKCQQLPHIFPVILLWHTWSLVPWSMCRCSASPTSHGTPSCVLHSNKLLKAASEALCFCICLPFPCAFPPGPPCNPQLILVNFSFKNQLRYHFYPGLPRWFCFPRRAPSLCVQTWSTHLYPAMTTFQCATELVMPLQWLIHLTSFVS